MDSLRRLARLGERMAVMAATNGALDAKPSVGDAFADFQLQAGYDFTADEGRADLTDDLVRISVSRALWLFHSGFDAGFFAAIEGVRRSSRQATEQAVR